MGFCYLVDFYVFLLGFVFWGLSLGFLNRPNLISFGVIMSFLKSLEH